MSHTWSHRYWLYMASAGVALVLEVQPYRPLVFMGPSMEPTYPNLSVSLTVPPSKPLRRGDIVVVRTPNGPIVKRVAYLPGDKVHQFWGLDGWIDFIGYGEGVARQNRRFRFRTVPAGGVYVLGDNLAASVDSRSFGFVRQTDVIRVIAFARPNGTKQLPRTGPMWDSFDQRQSALRQAGAGRTKRGA